jgi:molybdopterin synthase catalytic subunit
LTKTAIDPAEVLKLVRDESAGGTVVFLGTIRRRSERRAVTLLEYEVYREMAQQRMLQIEREVRGKWPVKKMVMVHRYGTLKVGEISVAVAVSSEHRGEAFEACRYAIDEIKRRLPMWKRESWRGGRASWVRGRPIEG